METPMATVKPVSAAEAPAFVRGVLFSRARSKPVVAISSKGRAGNFLLDPAAAAEALGDRADVVTIETGEAAWALSGLLPKRMDVYGGAARIWWPGLSPVSDPQAHPLVFIWSAEEAPRVLQSIVASVTHGQPKVLRAEPAPTDAGTAPASASAPDAATEPDPTPIRNGEPPGLTAAPGRILDAIVDSLAGGRIRVRVGGRMGPVKFADVPLARLAEELRPGQRIRVREVVEPGRRDPAFSVRGLLRDPWTRIAAEYAVGDVVRARVARLGEGHLLVELLPDAHALVPVRELDWTFVRHPGDLYKGGELVRVKILTLEPEIRKCTASVKQAFGGVLHEAIAAGPGEEPFLGGGDEAAAAFGAPVPEAGSLGASEARQLKEELDSALQDREDLLRQKTEDHEQIAALKKEVRSAEDRLRALEGRLTAGLDPTSSETAFLLAVRVEYARKFDESDRLAFPLQRMRVGREFLARLRALEGVEVEKVVEVCAQVASGRAHQVQGRSVHELRSGAPGSPGRVRAADGAKTWRCSLQDGTPSARRLHWWQIPGPAGATIEFAGVALHDDVSIPD